MELLLLGFAGGYAVRHLYYAKVLLGLEKLKAWVRTIVK